MFQISRRRCIQSLCAFPLLFGFTQFNLANTAIDLVKLKSGYGQRLKKILASNELPYIDIESSCNSGKVDIDEVAQNMDRYHIGLMALSADPGRKQFENKIRYDDLSARLLAAYPDRFIPVGNGGQPPNLTQAPEEFLNAQDQAAQSKQILLFGEYEFRHYPSPRQVKRGETDRDVNVPIDGPVGQQLFSISEKTGLAFQIHYEIEDRLLPPLEKMLQQYPKAKVIWCHLAQIRYADRASTYHATYMDQLLKKHPNLYCDTAFGDANSVYPVSNEKHARVWADFDHIKAEWRDLIIAHPMRFLSALDLGQDRLDKFEKYDRNHRHFLQQFPKEIQHRIAYQNAWRLLFGEEFS